MRIAAGPPFSISRMWSVELCSAFVCSATSSRIRLFVFGTLVLVSVFCALLYRFRGPEVSFRFLSRFSYHSSPHSICRPAQQSFGSILGVQKLRMFAIPFALTCPRFHFCTSRVARLLGTCLCCF